MSPRPPHVVVLTGATDGLGRALALRLADRPDTLLVLHGRDARRLAELSRTLADRPAEIATVHADLSVLSEVRLLREQVAALTGHVSVLVNNAGIGPGERRLTVDGHERSFAVNYLAPFVLTRDLLPLLRAGAPSRVVHVASLGQAGIDLDDLTLEARYSGSRAYGQSKTALIADGYTLAADLRPDEVTVNSLRPGTHMPTKMVLRTGTGTVDALDVGVDATLELIASEALAGVTGRFFVGGRPSRAHPDAEDAALRRRLLEITNTLVR